MTLTNTLENSHMQVIQSLDDLPEVEWDMPNVCGEWSVKDIIAHLASYERLLVDVLHTFQGSEPTPYIQTFLANPEGFNKNIVESRKYMPAQQVLNEYQEAQLQTVSLLAQIPAEKQRETLPWFGEKRSLDDVVKQLCSHAEEHCRQIVQFRERRKQEISG